MVVSSSSSYPVQDVLAALRLHQEWGVDELIEDVPWAIWQEEPARPAIGRGGVAPSSSSAERLTAKQETRSLQEAQVALAKAEDPEALLQAGRHIPGVTLARTAKHHLGLHLVKDAPFLLIGDVPNEDEDRHGTLFAGEMGRLLERILVSIGMKREQLSCVPAIPWRPPGGQRVSQRELELCVPILHRAIALAQPSRIVTMGATPAWMLLRQEVRLSQLRGRWHEVMIPSMAAPIPLLPLWHPAQLGDNAGRRRHLWADILLLEETLQKEKVR